MMRRVPFFTTLSLILVLLLLSFGIYSLLYPLSKTRNRITFIFADTNLYLEIIGKADWAKEGDKNFNASTQDGILNNETWNVPDIIFSVQEGNELREAEIEIRIINHNPKKQVKISISNVAFDSEPVYMENPRFVTTVESSDSELGFVHRNDITGSDHLITPPAIKASPDAQNPNFIILTFRYELIRENVDFEFIQNLSITFETI